MLPACRFCGTAYPHHLEAAKLAGQVHAVMRGVVGPMPPMPQQGGGSAPVVVVPGMQPIAHASSLYVHQSVSLGASPPATGGPVASGGPSPAPWGDPRLDHRNHSRLSMWIWVTVIVFLLLAFLGFLAGFFFVFGMLR